MHSKAVTEYIENMRRFLGYDKSFIERYFIWWKDILTGNFGYSIRFGTKVSDFLGSYIGRSFKVNIFGFIFAFMISIPVGIKSAVNKDPESVHELLVDLKNFKEENY